MAINYPTALDSFATAVDNVTAHVAQDINDMRDGVEALETKVGIDSSLVTTSLDYLVNSFFENGRRLWLYEDSAPTGWTYLASVADRVIGVKGGSNAFNVAGGNQAGSWTQSTHLHTGSIHIHQWYVKNGSLNKDQSYDSDGVAEDIAKTTGKTKNFISIKNVITADRPNRDMYTKTSTTGYTGNSPTTNTWRPYGAVGIIVEKD